MNANIVKRCQLLYVFATVIIGSLTLSCTSWETIEDPKWGFKLEVPPSLQDKNFEGKDLWVHEDSLIRVIIDFGTLRPQEVWKLKENYSERSVRVDGYNATIYTYKEQNSSGKGKFENVASLIFQESPQSYGEGKPPVFRVEYGSEKDRETALQILQSVRFYDPLAN